MSDIEVLPPEPDRSRAHRMDSNVVTNITAKYSSVLVAFLLMFIVMPAGTWALGRLITTQDEQTKKQAELERQFATLHTQVVNIVSDQVQNSKNIQDRIESGEKVLNDRVNTQGGWLQQLSEKFDRLSQYVYQNVRQQAQTR